MDDEDDEDQLDSDELGTKGEALFQSLCASGKLICNPATRDRSGWDFVVEFRIDHSNPGWLDRRDNPISALFQQKTMWDTSDRIKFRLSSIERLAKDPRPSFIYVLKLDKQSHEPTSAILIEMRGEALSKVLHKLRQEHAANRFAVNKASMYLYPGAIGVEVEPTGPALREAISRAAGPDMAAYAKSKHDEIVDIGFEPHARKLNITLAVQSTADLADVMLGITKARATGIRATETRFGITLDTPDIPQAGEIRFTPEPFDSCEIVIRRDALAEPAVFAGKVYFAPLGPDLAARLVTDGFEINLRGNSFNYRSAPVGPDAPLMTAAQWRNYFLMADALARPGATIEIRPGDPTRGAIKHTISTAATGAPPETIAWGLTASGMLTTMLKHAGTVSEPKFTLLEMVSQLNDISSGFAFLSGDEDLAPLTFSTSGQLPDTVGHEVEALHINYALLGTELLVWTVATTLQRVEESDRSSFRSTRLELEELKLMPSQRYEHYVKELGERGPSLIMARPLPAASPEAPPVS